LISPEVKNPPRAYQNPAIDIGSSGFKKFG